MSKNKKTIRKAFHEMRQQYGQVFEDLTMSFNEPQIACMNCVHIIAVVGYAGVIVCALRLFMKLISNVDLVLGGCLLLCSFGLYICGCQFTRWSSFVESYSKPTLLNLQWAALFSQVYVALFAMIGASTWIVASIHLEIYQRFAFGDFVSYVVILALFFLSLERYWGFVKIDSVRKTMAETDH